MHQYKKIFFLCFSALLFLCSFVSLLFCFSLTAKAENDITISPLIFEEKVSPGQTLEAKIYLVNNAETEKEMYVFPMDFRPTGESGIAQIVTPNLNNKYSVASWINITKDPLAFKPGERKGIPIKLTIPNDIGPGGYYGAVTMGTIPGKFEPDNKDSGINIGHQAATLFLMQVRGDVNENINIRQFAPEKKIYSTPFNVQIDTIIENLGNTHIKPLGEIQIINMVGKNIATLQFNEKEGYILPSTKRKFTNNWIGRFGFGKYTLELIVTYGTKASDGGQGLQTETYKNSVWILPWKIITPAVIGLLILIILLIIFVKFSKNKAIKKALQDMGVGREQYVKKYVGPSPTLRMGIILTIIFLIIVLLLVLMYFLFM